MLPAVTLPSDTLIGTEWIRTRDNVRVQVIDTRTISGRMELHLSVVSENRTYWAPVTSLEDRYRVLAAGVVI